MSSVPVRYWVRGNDGKTYGPVDIAEMQGWVNNRTMNSETLVCREDDPSNHWIRASGLVGIQFSDYSPRPTSQMPEATSTANSQTAKTMIVFSNICGWGGLALLFLLCPLFAVVGASEFAVVLGSLGFLSACVGAILGQIGRGMQGRVL